jgi:hypothetical protein
VVNIELADVYWYEPTLLTLCAFVLGVWIDAVVIGSLPYCATAVPASQWILFISQLNLSGATNRARGSAFLLVMVSEFVVHLYLLGTVRLLDSRS